MSKSDLKDTAPRGILIFTDLLNLKLLQHYSFKKARS
jgi:hypothetical protein